jgi:hypothetical protein
MAECSTVESLTETRWMPSPQSPGANGVEKHSPTPCPDRAVEPLVVVLDP